MDYGTLQTTKFIHEEHGRPAYLNWRFKNQDATTRFFIPTLATTNTISGTTRVNSQYESCLIIILDENMDIIAKTKSDENGVYTVPSNAVGNYIIAKPLTDQACPMISGKVDHNDVEIPWANLKQKHNDGEFSDVTGLQ